MGTSYVFFSFLKKLMRQFAFLLYVFNFFFFQNYMIWYELIDYRDLHVEKKYNDLAADLIANYLRSVRRARRLERWRFTGRIVQTLFSFLHYAYNIVREEQGERSFSPLVVLIIISFRRRVISAMLVLYYTRYVNAIILLSLSFSSRLRVLEFSGVLCAFRVESLRDSRGPIRAGTDRNGQVPTRIRRWYWSAENSTVGIGPIFTRPPLQQVLFPG